MNAHSPRKPTILLLAVLAAALTVAHPAVTPADVPATAPTTRPTTAPAAPRYELLARRGEDRDAGPSKVRPTFRARFDATGDRLMTASTDRVEVWAVPSMKPVMEPLKLSPPIEAADLTPDGTLLLTAEKDGWLRVRRVGADAPLWSDQRPAGFEQAEFTPDGRSVMVVERRGRTVRLLDAGTGKATLTITDETSEYRLHAAISRDGTRIVTSSLGPTRVWSASTGKPVSSAPRFGSVFTISPDGRRVAGLAQAGEVSIFDAADGKALAKIKAEDRDDSQVANIWALAFSPDGRRIAISKDDLGVQIWDAATGNPASPPLKPLYCDIAPISSILFTPEGRRVVLANEHGASVWDVSTGTRLAEMDHTILGWPAPVGIAVTPEGRYVAVNFGGPVELWEHRR